VRDCSGKPAAQRGLGTESPTRSAAKGHAKIPYLKLMPIENGTGYIQPTCLLDYTLPLKKGIKFI